MFVTFVAKFLAHLRSYVAYLGILGVLSGHFYAKVEVELGDDRNEWRVAHNGGKFVVRRKSGLMYFGPHLIDYDPYCLAGWLSLVDRLQTFPSL